MAALSLGAANLARSLRASVAKCRNLLDAKRRVGAQRYRTSAIKSHQCGSQLRLDLRHMRLLGRIACRGTTPGRVSLVLLLTERWTNRDWHHKKKSPARLSFTSVDVVRPCVSLRHVRTSVSLKRNRLSSCSLSAATKQPYTHNQGTNPVVGYHVSGHKKAQFPVVAGAHGANGGDLLDLRRPVCGHHATSHLRNGTHRAPPNVLRPAAGRECTKDMLRSCRPSEFFFFFLCLDFFCLYFRCGLFGLVLSRFSVPCSKNGCLLVAFVRAMGFQQ